MRNDKVDGMLYHNLSTKSSYISDDKYTCPQRVPKSYIEYSADTNELGEFESCAVQGDVSLKKQCDQRIPQDAL